MLMRHSAPWKGVLWGLLAASFFACEPTAQPGEAVAKTYCGSCHLFPEPNLLPAAIWEKEVLPVMSAYLGMREGQRRIIPTVTPEDRIRIARAGIFPQDPVLTPAQWDLITQYYLDHAPDSLPSRSELPVRPDLAQSFTLRTVSLRDTHDLSMLKYDAAAHRLWYGTRGGGLGFLHPDYSSAPVQEFASAPVDADFAGAATTVALVGKMNPGDAYLGEMVQLSGRGNAVPGSWLGEINRPVDLLATDLTGDGTPDWVVCEYGNYLGSLFWVEVNAQGQPGPRRVLRPVSGARKVIATDANNDGKTDILALFAQGDESVVLYTNQGNGAFEERTLLRFPPVYGSGYIELADVNGDGFEDLVYANGDNGDLSQVFKPYHGVRVYVNDGKWNFSEAWFFPMNGAGRTLTRDFDQDGDLDIAAISFFPDVAHEPDRGFIYFEQTSSLTFTARTDPETARGRWLVMAASDMDRDGYDDLVLGSAIRAPGMGFLKKKDTRYVQLMVFSFRK